MVPSNCIPLYSLPSSVKKTSNQLFVVQSFARVIQLLSDGSWAQTRVFWLCRQHHDAGRVIRRQASLSSNIISYLEGMSTGDPDQTCPTGVLARSEPGCMEEWQCHVHVCAYVWSMAILCLQNPQSFRALGRAGVDRTSQAPAHAVCITNDAGSPLCTWGILQDSAVQPTEAGVIGIPLH